MAHSTKLIVESYRHILQSEFNLKYVLAIIKKPIVCGMAVYENFEELNEHNYILNKPKINEKLLGHHAILIYGYDDIQKCFLIINSYGVEFGKNGTFMMSYEYMLDPNLVFEHWVCNS